MNHKILMRAKELKTGRSWQKVADVLHAENLGSFEARYLSNAVKRHDSQDCAQCLIDELEVVILKAILALEVDESIDEALKILRRA